MATCGQGSVGDLEEPGYAQDNGNKQVMQYGLGGYGDNGLTIQLDDLSGLFQS